MHHVMFFFLEQGYFNEPYYQDPNPGEAQAEEAGQSDMFDDEGVRRAPPFPHISPLLSFETTHLKYFCMFFTCLFNSIVYAQ